jgi:mannose-6-phosphate isomerase
LVLDVESGGFVYLGFRENIRQEDIIENLQTGQVCAVLHKVYPKPGQLIAVPPGCVHAVGPGVLIAEPQYVLPNRSAVTWRISDWGRRYDAQGRLSPSGQPRELHLEKALTALDWALPRGHELERLLITDLLQSPRFVGNPYNCFATQAYFRPGNYTYRPLVPGSFSLFTIWRGCVRLETADGAAAVLQAGQSGLVSASTSALAFNVCPEARGGGPHVGMAFFALT